MYPWRETKRIMPMNYVSLKMSKSCSMSRENTKKVKNPFTGIHTARAATF